MHLHRIEKTLNRTLEIIVEHCKKWKQESDKENLPVIKTAVNPTVTGEDNCGFIVIMGLLSW